MKKHIVVLTKGIEKKDLSGTAGCCTFSMIFVTK